MGYIFISYSHKDSEYVHELQAALQKEGFDAWIDDRIDYGDKWPTVIQNKLDKCDAFVIVMSGNAFESDMVQNEVTRAREKRKPIFPLLLDGENWLIVQAKQFVDVRDGSFPSEKFYKRLESVTRRNKGGIKPEPPEPNWLVRQLIALRTAFFKAPVFGSVGIVSLFLGLFCLGSWLGPILFSLVPSASPTATVTVTSTHTERPATVKVLPPTSTKTKTPTATVTSTGTATRTPTNTFTPTPTYTPTFTPTPLPTIHADIRSVRSAYPLGVQIKFLSERSTITDAGGRKSYCYQAHTCTYEWKLFTATGSQVDLDQNSIYVFTFDTPGIYTLSLKICYRDTESCDTDTLRFEVDR